MSNLFGILTILQWFIKLFEKTPEEKIEVIEAEIAKEEDKAKKEGKPTW